MVAIYPPRVEVYAEKRDFVDPIWALHWNTMQDEIRATETTVGLNPQIATKDPADVTKNYVTVTDRVAAAARGETMCAYRGYTYDFQVSCSLSARPVLQTALDTHNGATESGYKLPQTGYWLIEAKADWKPTAASAVHPTTRAVGIEINEEDLGLTDSVLETPATKDNMTTQVVWAERMKKGTFISLRLRAGNGDQELNPMTANAYLRVSLIRCVDEGTIIGLPVLNFQPDPPPDPPKCGDHPIITWNPKIIPVTPTPVYVSHIFDRNYTVAVERYDGGYNVSYANGSGSGAFTGVWYPVSQLQM